MKKNETIDASASRELEDDGRFWVPAHRGTAYRVVLQTLHSVLKPRSYVEIGVYNGATLALSRCASVGVDPQFKIDQNVVGEKPSLALQQCTSDKFFEEFDPDQTFNSSSVDFFFLDGMHLFEFLLRDFMNAERFSRSNSIIALHDCLPVDFRMTRRTQDESSSSPTIHPASWWTGDVWRLLPILKKYRPDLSIHCLDAPPTGLVIITGLNPTSKVLSEQYSEIVKEGLELDLSKIGVSEFLKSVSIKSTEKYKSREQISRHFWL